MLRNIIIFSIAILVIIGSNSKIVFGIFEGDENNFKDVAKYLEGNMDEYLCDLSKIKSSKERREIIRLRKEMERLALKIDAGDIKDDELRKKIVALRRKAFKKINRDEFVINNFDRHGNNRLGGEIGTEFSGEYLYNSPWLNYSLEDEENRVGKKVINFEYDINEGPVTFYSEVKLHQQFKKNNAIGFKIKSEADAILVQFECEEGLRHDYVVTKLKNQWKTVVIPFKKFSNYENFDARKIKKINFILNDQITYPLTGMFSLNDLILKNIGEKGVQVVPKHVIKYEVEGTVPLGSNKSFFRKK